MIEPVRPNTESTGAIDVASVHTGVPLMMTRTWPLAPAASSDALSDEFPT